MYTLLLTFYTLYTELFLLYTLYILYENENRMYIVHLNNDTL